MTKIKIFQAGMDSNADDFLETEMNKWLVSSVKYREIVSMTPALTNKEIFIFTVYTETDRNLLEQRKHLEYLQKNSKAIFGRILEFEEYRDMGFEV